MKKEEKICIGCGNDKKLHKLQSGKYVCKDCLDQICKKQYEIKKDIEEILTNKYGISKPKDIIKLLDSIILSMKHDYDLLSKKEKKEIIKVSKSFMKEVD